MPVNKEGNIIFSEKRCAETEYGASIDIEVFRHIDGSVHIVLGSWTERTDKSIRAYKLSAKDTEHLGKLLLCMPEDEDFDGITSRAAAWSE